MFDDYGRPIQAKSTNITGGNDVVTNQSDFSGKPLVTHSQSQKGGSNPLTTTQIIRNTYDVAGRLTKTTHQLNTNIAVTIAEMDYDALGQLKTKKLGQQRDANGNYTTNPLETLDYTYNIRGWLKGVNENYVNSNLPSIGGAGGGSWFGFQLSYDYGFSSGGLFNGNIAGMIWKNRGSDKQRAYGFDYDNANRLLKGDFSEKKPDVPVAGGTGYAQADGINYNMLMGDGVNYNSAYDANGNINRMQHWGLTLTTSSQIDDLQYMYNANSNKLQKVNDLSTPIAGVVLGDFKVSAKYQPSKASSTADYTYDANGNLKKDLNKDIGNATVDGIAYNHLNLPQTITVYNASNGVKGTIQYVYDATGNKLQKIVTEIPSSGGAGVVTTTTYMHGAVYEEKSNATTPAPNGGLQFFSTSEGRVRLPSLQGGAGGGLYDYMLKDHLGNVRTVLTDEVKTDIYHAGFEETNQPTEDQLFLNYNEHGNTIVPKPNCFDNAEINERVLKLSKNAETNTHAVLGTGKVLKVMAGDKVNIAVKTWFNTSENHDAGGEESREILQALVTQFFASGIQATGTKGGVSLSTLQNNVGSQIQNFLGTQSNVTYDDGAFLNWVFLDDEQLKYVPDNSGFVSVLPIMFENRNYDCKEPAATIPAIRHVPSGHVE